MGRRETPLDASEGPVRAFAGDLRELRRAAGNPPYRSLAAKAYCSASALANAASGKDLPSLNITLAYVKACGGDVAAWERRWYEVNAGLARPEAPAPSGPAIPKTPRWRWGAVGLVVAALVGGVLILGRGGPPVPVDLIQLAKSASWRSGQGAVLWASGTPVEGGSANVALQAPMESGVRVERVLAMHPQWVPQGYVEGDIRLPRPLDERDHLVGTVGFFVDEPCFITGCRIGGEVDFSVYVVDSRGPRRIYAVRDVGNDWRTPRLDLNMSAYRGVNVLRIRVDAGETAAQDWAGWWDLRLEPRE